MFFTAKCEICGKKDWKCNMDGGARLIFLGRKVGEGEIKTGGYCLYDGSGGGYWLTNGKETVTFLIESIDKVRVHRECVEQAEPHCLVRVKCTVCRGDWITAEEYFNLRESNYGTD